MERARKKGANVKSRTMLDELADIGASLVAGPLGARTPLGKAASKVARMGILTLGDSIRRGHGLDGTISWKESARRARQITIPFVDAPQIAYQDSDSVFFEASPKHRHTKSQTIAPGVEYFPAPKKRTR